MFGFLLRRPAMSRSDVARVDFYFDDWLTGTMELSAEERGAYITVCALIWKTGNRLKDNETILARWCAMSVRRWRAMRQVLIEAGKLEVVDGFIRQQRAEAELETARERREKARENGAKGGRKKAENSANPRKDNGSGSSDPTTYQQQHQHLQEEEESNLPAAESLPRAPAREPDGADAPAAAGAEPIELVSVEQMDQLLKAYPFHNKTSLQRRLVELGRGAPPGAVGRGVGKGFRAGARDVLEYARKPIADEAAAVMAKVQLADKPQRSRHEIANEIFINSVAKCGRVDDHDDDFSPAYRQLAHEVETDV
jgi:uncharacterized protein YdaU (DUF1376 family)